MKNDLLSKINLFYKLAQPLPNETKLTTSLISFKRSLEHLLDKGISDSDFISWLLTNQSLNEFKTAFFNMRYGGQPNTDHIEGIYGSNKAMISVNRLESHYNPVSEGILNPSKNIPKLFIRIEDFYSDKPKLVDKLVANEQWLISCFVKILRYEESKIDRLLPKFISDNQSKINSLKTFWTKNPTILGSGADGIAFDIGNGMVMKIFQEKFAYEKAKAAQERLFSNRLMPETEAMIYDIGEFKMPGTMIDPLYYLIIERMANVKDMREQYNLPKEYDIETILYVIKKLIISNDKYTELRGTRKTLNNNEIIQKIKEITLDIIKDVNNECSGNIENIEETTAMSKDWLTKLIYEIIVKLLTERKDLHMGNIGINQQGYFRFFDPAYGKGLSSNFD